MGILSRRAAKQANPFKSPVAERLDAVRVKLATVTEAIPHEQAKYEAMALAGFEAGPDSGEFALATQQRDYVAKLRDDRDMLTAALSQAERDEQARQARRRQEKYDTDRRALTSHLAVWQRGVADLGHHAEKMQASFDNAMRAAVAINNLVNFDHPNSGAIRETVGDEDVRKLAMVAMAAIGKEAAVPFYTGHSAIREYEDYRGSVPPLADLAATAVQNVKNLFAAASPEAVSAAKGTLDASAGAAAAPGQVGQGQVAVDANGQRHENPPVAAARLPDVQDPATAVPIFTPEPLGASPVSETPDPLNDTSEAVALATDDAPPPPAGSAVDTLAILLGR